jgi:plastocyanin
VQGLRLRGRVLVLAGVVAASAAVGLTVATAVGAHPTTQERLSACGVTVKAMAGEKVAINRYLQDNMRFAPGTVRVKSGCTLTFKYGTPGQMEPHTLTIVAAAKLPKTVRQVENCSACNVALAHLKNPKSPQTAGTPANPLIHPILQAGKPTDEKTLDGQLGDSLAIEPVPGHKSITVKVTAPPGTVVHFLCAVHPWMQGKIIVN